jgi:hypothetical protein
MYSEKFTKKMKINFLLKGGMNTGSSRVHGFLIQQRLQKLGYDAVVNGQLEGSNVIIFEKNYPLDEVQIISNSILNCVFIDTNPSKRTWPKRKKLEVVDAILLGSDIEKSGFKLPHIVYPQYEDQELFNQENKIVSDDIIVGYHGNNMHIEPIEKNFIDALCRIGKNRKVIFKVFASTPPSHLEKLDKNIRIECIKWNYNNYHEIIKNFDVGYLPSLSKVNFTKLAKILTYSRKSFSDDVISRYKPNSNAGRLISFMQAGVPVIGDYGPYNFLLGEQSELGFKCSTVMDYENALISIIDRKFDMEKFMKKRDLFMKLYFDVDEDTHSFAKFCYNLWVSKCK